MRAVPALRGPMFLLALLGSTLLPSAALAATTSQFGNDIIYSAAAGEVNELSVAGSAGGAITLRDSAGITPGGGCSRPDPADSTVVRCGASTRIGIGLGDRDDSVDLTASPLTRHEVWTGEGNDRLTGSPAVDMLAGEGHSDTIEGGGGNDGLHGDRAAGNCCAPGSDERPDRDPALDPGNDKLEGGPGVDFFYGGAGNDSILARDGVAEQITCGSGTDTTTADSTDTEQACEKEGTAGPADRAVLVSKSARVAKGKLVPVKLECEKASGSCSGTLELIAKHRVIGRRKFEIDAGDSEKVRVKLRRRGRRLFPPGKRRRVTVRLIERDAEGNLNVEKEKLKIRRPG